MAYDALLARRVRELLEGQPGVVEKKMFGGVAFLVNGNMSVGIHRDHLVVRMDPTNAQAALGEPGVRAFDITGRPMKGWVLVEPQALGSPHELAGWVRRGVEFAATLPRK